MEESLGKCPLCGKEVKKVSGHNFYACVDRDCKFIIGENICGAEITEEDVQAILKQETTKEKEFTWKSGKKGKAKLKWSDEEKRVVFVFEDKPTNQKSICKCPICGADVHLIKDKFYVCASGKDKCGFIISKELFGVSLTDEEIKNLCEGKETEEKNMTFKNGKTGTGKLSYNKDDKKIEIIFNK